MQRLVAQIQALVRELRRRQVIRVAVVYAGTAFVILQLGGILVESFGLPRWTLRMVTFLPMLGFPLAVGLTWVFDVTEEGLVWIAEEVGTLGAGGKPFTSDAVVIGLLALIAGLLLYPRLFSPVEEPARQAPPADSARVKERTIAVLPFEVSGGGVEEWHDGMVTALSLHLDGAAGLRKIPDRRTFAAAEQIDSTECGAGGSQPRAPIPD
jgi:hypothetical protein